MAVAAAAMVAEKAESVHHLLLGCSSPRIAGTPEETEESLDDAVILESLLKGSVSNHFLFEQVLLTSSSVSPAMQGLLVNTSVPNMESVSLEESLLSSCFLVFAGLDLLHRPPMRGSGKQAPLLCT
jgi:hypothetical protein